MQSDWIEQVTRYWFEELRPDAWFRKDPRVDAEIRERFAALHDEVAQLRPEQLTSPRACLAAVLVLDQFSRNMFRGSPRSFAGWRGSAASSASATRPAIRATWTTTSSPPTARSRS